MARLIVQTDLSGTITRQTLANMWEDASISSVVVGDFVRDQLQAQLASTVTEFPTTPVPGALVWSQSEQIMYVWHDEINDTAVSLWLAVGPDVIETACLAAEPIPAGAAVAPFYDRWVTVADPSNPPPNCSRMVAIGVNQSGLPHVFDEYVEGDTAASGTWIRVGIDGYVRACFPKEDSGVSEAHFGTDTTFGGTYHTGLLGGLTSRFTGLFGRPNGGDGGVDSQVGAACHVVSNYSGMTLAYARVRWSGHRRFI